ncbi:Flp family type IVb pilin [Sphingomonas sp. URHD0057]|uniref:Flp family type IVb pilin n=1 Tax=Sphingomonas sp. URHD0057 TaxID=1380389 RepID=UPI001E57417B|nr:Flp family type IVb pilin [Sphingomonas sp. URHD0057]
MTKFINMLNDDSGASAAEYALILAIVGAGIAIAAWTLGKNISNAMGSVGNKIATCTTSTPSVTPVGC